MNGPPRFAGFCKAATCNCGDATNDCMIFKCRLVTYIEEVAGAMRLVQAYHWLNSGSTKTFGLRYRLRTVMTPELQTHQVANHSARPEASACERKSASVATCDTRIIVT